MNERLYVCDHPHKEYCACWGENKCFYTGECEYLTEVTIQSLYEKIKKLESLIVDTSR